MKNYLGLKDIDYINRGAKYDPLVEYKGFRWPEWVIENTMWERWKEYLQDFDYLSEQNYIEPWEVYQRGRTEDLLKELLGNMGYLDIYYIHENAPFWFNMLADNIFYNGECEGGYPTEEEVIEHYKHISFVVEDFVSA